MTDPLRLDERNIAKNLKTRRIGRSLSIVEECTSTNDLAERMANEGASHGFVAIAEKQSAGRGRLGRTWHSPTGGIWLSVLIRPRKLPYSPSEFPLMGALAIARAIHSQLGIKAGVRWPNDVVVDGRKIAGVLVETKSKGNELTYTILGLGINANFETDKIDAIRNTATSLLTLHSGAIDREALICAVLLEIESLYESLCSDERDLVIGLLREVDWSRGKSVRVKLADREVLGIVDDYETLGSVRIVTQVGSESVETSTLVSVEYQSD